MGTFGRGEGLSASGEHLLSVDEYRGLLADGVRRCFPSGLGTQVVPLEAARGRVLAADVSAVVAVPPFDNSSMDGFALRVEDFRSACGGVSVCLDSDSRSCEPLAVLPVSGDVPAGGRAGVLKEGTCVRVMTGAMLPVGADAVVMVEDTNLSPGPGSLPSRVEFFRFPVCGQNIRRAGEGMVAGESLLKAGSYLNAQSIGALAATGHGEVLVRRRLRVGILVTGDELVPAGEPLGCGQIHDSNSLLLRALVEDAGAEVVRVVHCGDDPGSFLGFLEDAGRGVDVVLSTGGVSAGAFDVVKEMLSDRGVGFYKVGMQPGKPQGFGVLSGGIFADSAVLMVTFPGNPVSVFVSFHVFFRHVLSLLQGQDSFALSAGGLGRVWARTCELWSFKPGRVKFVPVSIESDCGPEGLPIVRSLHSQIIGSHLINTLRDCDGLAVVDASTASLVEGSRVEVFLT